MRLIDADAIISVMDKCAETPEDDVAKLCYLYTSRILKDAPTIDAVPVVHGEWIFQRIRGSMGTKTCSVCGYQSWQSIMRMDNIGNYCPNCGARMDGGEHDLR